MGAEHLDIDTLAPAAAIALAIRFHQKGELDQATRALEAALRQAPNEPGALHLYGMLLCQRGYEMDIGGADLIERGRETLQHAIALAPDYPDSHNQLAVIHLQAGELELGERHLRIAHSLRPDSADTIFNLGVLCKQLGRFEEAATFFRRATELAPDAAEGFQLYGETLRRLNRFEEGASAFARAVALSPRATSFRDLFRTRRQLGDRAGALAALEHWLEHDRSDPVALHLRAAITQEGVPERASDGYVAQTFDGFAETYDAVHIGLQHRSPSLVAEAFAALGTGVRLRVLDAGCGTGLLAELLQPPPNELVGVDLSTGMLSRARARGRYTDLVCAELTSYLQAHPRSVDAILCVDALCYFGDLEPVIRAASRALREGGAFVFTLEKAEHGQSAFMLREHARYVHAPEHVMGLLRATGFREIAATEHSLRLDYGGPVIGLVFTARVEPRPGRR